VKNIAAILYAAIFIYLVFIGGDRSALTERSINLVPFKSIGFLVDRILSNGSYKYYLNIVGNVLLFVPLPFVLYYLSGVKNWLLFVLAGFFLSVGVEVTQYLFTLGIADIDDVILNTAGTALGCLLLLFSGETDQD